MTAVISVEHLTKKYDLGVIGTSTLARDLNRWWAQVRGKPDPESIVGQEDRTSRRTGTILALDDVSFTVQQGEALGIIGRNGAGKSTLLKILSQVTAPSSGRVRIKGRIASLLEVGTGFHPDLTGRENIFLNGAILGMSRNEIRSKFDDIVSFSEIQKFVDTSVKRYSSGMYVRLAFAVAAHLDPEILVVDEVLAVGDAEFQKKCLGKMGDVAGEGRTVLFVSHNMSSVQKLCSHSLWIDKGTVRKIGETGDIIHSYLENSNENGFSGEINLQTWPNRYGSGGVRILQARLLGVDESIASQFFRDDAFSLEFDFESAANHSLRFSAIILSDSGERVIHLSHHDTPGLIPGILRGKYRVRFTIPVLPLNEGTYRLLIGIHSDHDYPLDVVTDVLPFEVKDSINSTRPFLTTMKVGYCLVPNQCQVITLAGKMIDQDK